MASGDFRRCLNTMDAWPGRGHRVVTGAEVRAPLVASLTRVALEFDEEQVDAVRRLLVMLKHPSTYARVVAVVALVTAGSAVAVVLTHGNSTAAATASATTPSASSPGTPTLPPGKTQHASPNARGQLTALDGDRWTLSATGGATNTVVVNAQTLFGTPKAALDRARFNVGTQVAVTGPRSGDTVTAERIIIVPTYAGAPTAPVRTTTTPTATAPAPAPGPAAPPAVISCAINTEVSQALAYATSRGERASVAVDDTATGAYTAAGDADGQYSSASVVKVLMATDLLFTGQMNGATATTAYQMIVASDDDAADALYGLVGGDTVLTSIAAHYSILNLGSPPAATGQWGETQITADGLVHLYAKLKADPQVWPWLSNAMSSTNRRGSDGTDQFFGIPTAAADWAVKQGWMTGLGPGSTYNSTGYVDGNRYAVVILTYGSDAQYGQYMSDTITQMARDTMPGGVIGAPTASCPS